MCYISIELYSLQTTVIVIKLHPLNTFQFNGHRNHLRILLKCQFWFRKSGWGLRVCLAGKVLVDNGVAGALPGERHFPTVSSFTAGAVAEARQVEGLTPSRGQTRPSQGQSMRDLVQIHAQSASPWCYWKLCFQRDPLKRIRRESNAKLLKNV